MRDDNFEPPSDPRNPDYFLKQYLKIGNMFKKVTR